MVADADTYVRTLYYHITPNNHQPFRDLHTLPSPFLGTLLPHHSLLLAYTATMQHNLSALADALTVDGVRVSVPDIFHGPTFAVHGINGILLTGLNKYQDLDFKMDSDGLGIWFLPPELEISTPLSSPSPSDRLGVPFLPPEIAHLPSPSDGLGVPFLPPEIAPLPSPSDGLGMTFLPPKISPPIMDPWNINYPTIPSSSSAAKPPNISTCVGEMVFLERGKEEKKLGN